MINPSTCQIHWTNLPVQYCIPQEAVSDILTISYLEIHQNTFCLALLKTKFKSDI